jgi:hypothetical protein
MILDSSSEYSRNGVWVRQYVPGDEKYLLENMRKKDIEECKALGMSPGRGLRTSIKNSLYSKSVWLDGKIIAMIGLSGAVISEAGCAWMLTGNGIEKVPFTFMRIAKKEIDVMLIYKKILFNYVSKDYPEAVRFFEILGFSVSRPKQVGKHGNMFHQIMKTRD